MVTSRFDWQSRTVIRSIQSFLVPAIALATIGAAVRPAAGQSQASTGQVSGRAFDSSGAVMPGVTVTISGADTGVHREVLTNERGLYVIPLLPTGSYELSAALWGFLSVKRPGLEVTVGSAVTVDLPMRVEG